ncbi:MAG: hypothetical protein WAM79_12215 [Candidatus Sulfotelmatobacter sp.]
MPTHPKSHSDSPISILTELAVEGTASVIELQRALLDLAQQENGVLLDGVKSRVSGFVPAAAMTDAIRRSVDTLIGMQQELLTTTSKQTLQLLESEEGKAGRAAHLVELAREAANSFTRAQKKFLSVVEEETARAMSGKQEAKPVTPIELRQMAREAGDAFIEAQTRVLDVMRQQMNVQLDAATRIAELLSPSQLSPVANLASHSAKSFLEAQKSLVGSLIKERKANGAGRDKKRSRPHPRTEVAV